MSDQTHIGRCRLLELPVDIRIMLYKVTFYYPQGININFNASSRYLDHPHPAALSMTCWQLFNETRGWLWKLNTFHFQIPLPVDDPARSRQASVARRHPSARRTLRTRTGCSTHLAPALREKSLHFCSLAMRLPHANKMIQRLGSLAQHQGVITCMRQVFVHLGAQMNNKMVASFLTAWDQILPILFILKRRTSVHLLFVVRASRRLIIKFSFSLTDPRTTLSEFDSCVPRVDDQFTLPELSTINRIRVGLWTALLRNSEIRSMQSSSGDLYDKLFSADQWLAVDVNAAGSNVLEATREG